MQSAVWRNFRLLLILLLPSFYSASASEIDSIKAIINSSGKYTDKINAYLLFGEKYALKNFDETLEIANDGIGLAKKNSDQKSEANLKRFIGTAYYFKGNYEIAAKYFYESIALMESTGEGRNLALAYNDLAKLYRKTRILDRALANYDKSLSIFIALKDSVGISMIQNESGVVFEYMKVYEEAIKRYTSSYNIATALHDNMGVSYALSNLAGVYNLQMKFAEAEVFLKKALVIRKGLNDSLALGLVYEDIATNYYSQKKYDAAAIYADSSNRIAFLMNYPELQTENYLILANISKAKGDFNRAFSYLEKRVSIHDSLFNSEKLKQIEELNSKYESIKTAKIIQQQQFEINKRNYWIAAGTIFLVLLCIAAFSYYQHLQSKQRARLQQTVSEQQEMATASILEAEENERQRIAKDLHDGIGQMMSVAKMNLSALESKLAFSNESHHESYEKIITLIDESCKEIRSVSHNMMPNALLKNNLAEALKTFSNQVDHPGLHISLYAEGLESKMDNNTETILYRVIQEAVNNVIKHAGASKVDISVIKDSDGISVTVEDNGNGFDKASGHFSEGLGFKSIHSRIHFLKGTVEVVSSPGEGTLVSLHIPLNN